MRVVITAPDGEVLREIDDPDLLDFDAIAITRKRCTAVADDCAVRGVNIRETTYHSEGDAECIHCKRVLGTIVAEYATLFGVDEDRDFIQSFRGRVYGLEKPRFGA